MLGIIQTKREKSRYSYFLSSACVWLADQVQPQAVNQLRTRVVYLFPHTIQNMKKLILQWLYLK